MQKADISNYEKKVSGDLVYDQDLFTPPWTIDSTDFNRIDDQDFIDKTINILKNDHVTLFLTSEAGLRYGSSILIRYDEESLSIDKPLDLEGKPLFTFRVYFQDISKVWNFFVSKVLSDCPYSFCGAYPESVYRLQRRKYERVPTPDGTRAKFWENDQIHDAGIVKDISATGMLICTGNDKPIFTDDTLIREIAIALPRHPSSQRLDEHGNIVLPTIKQGRIVRSFREKGTDFICHGICFEDTPDIHEELNSFVSQQKQNISGS